MDGCDCIVHFKHGKMRIGVEVEYYLWKYNKNDRLFSLNKTTAGVYVDPVRFSINIPGRCQACAFSAKNKIYQDFIPEKLRKIVSKIIPEKNCK